MVTVVSLDVEDGPVGSNNELSSIGRSSSLSNRPNLVPFGIVQATGDLASCSCLSLSSLAVALVGFDFGVSSDLIFDNAQYAILLLLHRRL